MPTVPIVPNFVNGHTSSRQSSISSTSSLLRTPLPPQNVPEYSFESGLTTPGSEAGLSSIFYTTTDNDTTRASSITQSESSLPLLSLSITLHISINELLPPNRNVFTFFVKGTVLVTSSFTSFPDGSPHSSDADDKSRSQGVSFPRFRVLAADKNTSRRPLATVWITNRCYGRSPLQNSRTMD
jgi:hypothetical protein